MRDEIVPTGLCQSEAIPRAGSPVDPNYIGGQFSSLAQSYPTL